MRHALPARHDLRVLLLLAHAAATCALAGLVVVVQLVVYPAFLLVGPTPGWAAYHAAHSAAITRAVLLPWAVQGLTCALLLVRRPDGVPLWCALLAGALGLASVVLTAAWAVPLHTRLGEGYDERLARRLLTANAWRVLVWSASAAVALGALDLGSGG
ncbi:MAG: hypothetical protein JWM64_1236 [Frankiales bacterium]|nr:hypothetical protein [Frankiales bacterium]